MTQVSPTGAEHRRWVTIAIAYSLASLASGYMFALVLLALELALELLSEGAPRRLGAYFAYLLVGFLVSTVICFLAALPAVYVITLAEAYRVRSPAFYAAAGAGVAFVWWGAIYAIFFLARGSFNGGLFAGGLLVLSLPGLIGGLVYWWFAGRTTDARLKPTGRDCRYNRECARLYIDGVDVADIMIQHGHARPYNGRGPRGSWCP